MKLSETLTTLTNNGTGKYTYKNEAGTEIIINVVNDVADNFQTIVNNPAVTEIIKNIVKNTSGNVSYNDATKEFTYVDAAGATKVINISDLVKLSETVTTLTNNGSGSYTYKNEAGTQVGINVVNDVANNFQTIVNNPAVTEVIKNIVKKTDGNVSYNAATKEFSYVDVNGTPQVININDLVKLNETLTSLTYDDSSKVLTYKDEKGVFNQLNLGGSGAEPWYKVGTTAGATANTDNMYTQGWVGIGFNTPSAAPNEMLRVNGAITTVNSYYADYVFEDYFKGFSNIKADYKFQKLAEVDAYIQKNKHLPGITPINELVKTKEGYSFNVSELSIQLLEKTEELYLHVIEQDKELEAKNNEIQKLKTASDAMNARLEKLEKLMSEK